jgi:trans-L-3-hydroxyproline dehydratase
MPEMSVDLIVPATDPQAQMGYIIMEVMGYPIYSGSNTICTATALLETGSDSQARGHPALHAGIPRRAGADRGAGGERRGGGDHLRGLPSYIDTHRATIHVPGWVT